ncbi:hypothetical protein Aca07nite_88480 [Actinoplanes capillaceus]|uniref:Uncharacterized protein n=1 Tax=Actinoplanes campanulatus TaxID=113559 RepID=A0ABQ3WZL3_9ACTN|nr:hypothetical protein Aca07nite_88480 [Actinoplanes capillaceus]
MFRMRVRRWLALTATLAASAFLLPGYGHGDQHHDPAAPPTGTAAGQPPTASPDPEALCREEEARNPGVLCSVIIVSDGGATPPPAPMWPGPMPVPAHLTTDGAEGCVTGDARPVVRTVSPSTSVVFAGAAQDLDVFFEQAPLDGSEETLTTSIQGAVGERVVNDGDERGLGPGVSYRWRVSASPRTLDPGFDRPTTAWSPWCEFTVADDLIDMRTADDPDAVRTLGVAPARRYPVTLRVREWKLVLDALGDDDLAADSGASEMEAETKAHTRRIRSAIIGKIAGRASGATATVTLNGNDWASWVGSAIAGTASNWDEMYDIEPDTAGTDGTAYWKLLDRLSTELGGPQHTRLGYY